MKKLDALTGIRFVAAALVVVHHLAGFGGFNSSLESGVSLGDGAVSMFFELSGFVLFYAYDGIIDVRRYAVARFARIYPLHITCIGLILIFVNPYSGLANRLILLDNALLLQSYVPVSNLFFSVNSPSWSISTEAFFYLCFPFLLANFRGSWAWKLLLTLAPALSMILIVNLTELPDYHGMNWAPVSLGLLYINPLARLFEFTLGMGAAAVFLALRPRVTLGLAPWALVEAAALLLLVSNIALLPEIFQIGAAFGGSAAIEWLTHGPGFCFSTALFILAMALSRGPLSRLLGSKIMVYLGEISFAVYMTHYIILLAYLKHASWFSGWSGAQKLMLYIVVVLALSAGLYEFVEKPSRRLNLRLSRARNLNIIIAES